MFYIMSTMFVFTFKFSETMRTLFASLRASFVITSMDKKEKSETTNYVTFTTTAVRLVVLSLLRADHVRAIWKTRARRFFQKI